MTKLTWKQMASFQVGGAICLPVIMVGHAICRQYGLASALFAIGAGNLLLFLLAVASGRMSFERRVTTAENSVASFGEKGVLCFALVLLLAKVSWFAIQLNMMAEGLKAILPKALPLFAINLALGSLIVGFAVRGVEVLSRFAAYSLPLLIATMAYLLATEQGNRIPLEANIQLEGISIVVAAAISRVVDMPTFYRNAKTLRDCFTTIALLFLLALPACESVGLYLAYRQEGATLLSGLLGGGGVVWHAWMALFLVLSGWTTNNTNLYSAATCMSTLRNEWSERKRTLIAGGLGVALGCFGLLNYFTDVLQLLGIMVGAMGSVILTRYMLHSSSERPRQRLANFGAWAAGIAVGVCALFMGASITTVPVLDGGLTAAILTACAHYFVSEQALPSKESL